MLAKLKAIGAEFSTTLVGEVFYREFANRRQLGSYVGLASSPFCSGSLDRDQGISKAGNPKARTMMIELAWIWLRYQPESALSRWFRERVVGRITRKVHDLEAENAIMRYSGDHISKQINQLSNARGPSEFFEMLDGLEKQTLELAANGLKHGERTYRVNLGSSLQLVNTIRRVFGAPAKPTEPKATKRISRGYVY
jgi:hypothetical protein